MSLTAIICNNLFWGSLTTLLDHKTTLAYLAYLGYPDETRTSALQITRARKFDRRKGKVTRNVFLCYVCGAAGSGKTSLLRAFVGKSFKEGYEPTGKVISVVNSVDIDGSEKYLVVSIPLSCIRELTVLHATSFRSLVRDLKLKRYAAQERVILLTLLSIFTILAIRTHFHT